MATFIDRSVPKAEQEKAASLLLRMLEGSMWEVWQIARERAGEPAAQQGTDTIRFVQNAINALSDSFCMDRRSICSLTHSSRCKLRYFS